MRTGTSLLPAGDGASWVWRRRCGPSFAFYNTRGEVDRLVEALKKISGGGGGGSGRKSCDPPTGE